MSDTSLVFNLVARERVSETLNTVKEKFDQAATGIAAGVAGALGVGVAASMDMTAANAKLAAQLGIGPEKAAELSKVSASVYANAWGDSVETVNEAIRGVYQNIGDTSQAAGGLEGLTTKALALAETFDQEVGPATAAVGQMVKTGLARNADEAFDILTRGFQVGNDRAGDLLDTFVEYSTQFRDMGIDGQMAMGIIQQGLKGGARDADLVADAMKELNIRVKDGQSAAPALKKLGLSAKDMALAFNQGGPAATKALDTITDRLRAVKDPTERFTLSQQLLGTQSEDLAKALYSIDPSAAVGALGKVSGAADKMAKTVGNTPASALESFKRQAVVKLAAISGTFIQFAMDNQAVFEPLAYTLAGLAGTVLVVKAAMTTYAAVSSIVAGANAIISASAWGVIGNWIRMNAIGLAAYARIAGGAVVSAATTAAAWTGSALVSIGTWILAVIRAGATAALQFALMAAKAIVWAATMAAQWLIAMGPIGWIILAVAGLVTLIVMYWDQIKQWTVQLWGLIVGALVWAKDMMINAFMNFTLIGLLITHWTSIKNTAVSWWTSIVNWVKGVPGKIYNLWLNWTLAGLIVKHWSSVKTGTVNKATEMVNWVKGIPGKITSALGNLGHLLYNSGTALISGFINGIKAKIGSVRNAASSVVSAARDYFPFSPAKEGPFAGRGYTSYSGQALMEGFQQGITGQIPALQSLLNGLPGVAPQTVQPAPLTAGMAPALGNLAGSGQVTRVIVDVRGADEDLKRLFRKLVRVDGRGSAQTAFGRT